MLGVRFLSVKKRMFAALVLLCIGIGGVSPAAERGFYKGIALNDPLWLQFGPAVLTSCRRIDWYRGHPPLKENGKDVTITRINPEGKKEVWVESDLSKIDKDTLIESDKNFASVLGWIRSNFGNKLNCTPEKPDFR